MSLIMIPKLFIITFGFLCIMSINIEYIHGKFAVVGYLPEYRQRLLDEDHETRLAVMCDALTHLILFSVEVDNDGDIVAQDRVPSKDRLERVSRVCRNDRGTKILICFGGNSRSNGFSTVVTHEKIRAKFLASLGNFMNNHHFDGVDWNWEYPSTKEDWMGLGALTTEFKSRFPTKIQSMAYYPDGNQEKILSIMKISSYVEFFHAMVYDQRDKHSTFEFAEHAIKKAQQTGIAPKVTLGVPFYGRHIVTGEAKTFEDIMASSASLEVTADMNQVQGFYFNGPDMIRKKVKLAASSGIAGIMIWECGQDSPEGTLHKAIASQVLANMQHDEL